MQFCFGATCNYRYLDYLFSVLVNVNICIHNLKPSIIYALRSTYIC